MLIDVHQQLENAKKTLQVRRKKLLGAQVDALSTSEVGKKVTALNEENFQAATTLGEALIHRHREPSQTDLDAAAAMVGEKMTNDLITQSQRPEGHRTEPRTI